MPGDNPIGKQIGLVIQIVDDQNISFIVNNNVKCNIGNLVAVEFTKSVYVLAEIRKIELQFYLENVRQYLVAKAVENNVNKLTESHNQPRYGQYITARILGYYYLESESNLIEISSKINRYTTSAFEKVYLVEFGKSPSVYGLSISLTEHESARGNFSLGDLSFPVIVQSHEASKLFFDLKTFKRHSLICGVTGSGKSRLCALIIKEIAARGAHVNVLDPHDEYITLLKSSDRYRINIINQDNITFSEKYLNANTLTKLLPKLSEQQETVIFEFFNELRGNKVSIQKLSELLVKELLLEIEKANVKDVQILIGRSSEILKSSKNYTEYVMFLMAYLKTKISNGARPTRLDVLIAVISKINDLRLKNILSSTDPDWLKTNQNCVDIFNFDFSSNEYVRRFINSIIQFLLRKQDINEFRVFVIDEAHMLLKEKSETYRLLIQLLREARKFNISVIFVSQNLSDVPDEIKSQFQNQFNFRQDQLETTQFFADQICDVSLYSSKLNFAMKVSNVS